MTSEKEFHVGIKAVITNSKGQILLLKAPAWEKGNIPAHWDIPGGRIQEGGTPLETLKREILEETGINEVLDPKFMTAVISSHEIPKDGKKLGLVLFAYEAQIPEGSEVKLSEEHTEYAWFDKKEAAKLLSEKYPKEFTDMLTHD